MRLLIDGDACPDRQKVIELALHYGVEVLLFIDFAHVIEDERIQIIMCEVGKDSVDQMIQVLVCLKTMEILENKNKAMLDVYSSIAFSSFILFSISRHDCLASATPLIFPSSSIPKTMVPPS